MNVRDAWSDLKSRIFRRKGHGTENVPDNGSVYSTTQKSPEEGSPKENRSNRLETAGKLLGQVGPYAAGGAMLVSAYRTSIQERKTCLRVLQR